MNDTIYKMPGLYLIKFGSCFCLFYFTTLAVIGLSARGGYYNAFIANHLNYVDWLRFLILHSSKILISSLGFASILFDKYTLGIIGSGSIRMVYSCIGYGIMSFWTAFIFADNIRLQAKVKWILSGWMLILTLNIIRVSSLLILISKHWIVSAGFDNHTWFNIAAYLLIFILIYTYYTSQIKNLNTNS